MYSLSCRYLRLALLPNSNQSVRTSVFSDFQKPMFGDSFSMAIPLNQLYTKTLQVYVISVLGPCEDIIVSGQFPKRTCIGNNLSGTDN